MTDTISAPIIAVVAVFSRPGVMVILLEITSAWTRWNGCSAGNYQLMDKESMGRIFIPPQTGKMFILVP
jgi:hypothetical protein